MNRRHLLPAAALLVACQTSDSTVTTPKAPEAPPAATVNAAPPHAAHAGNGVLPGEQLARVRRATARYHDIERAKADGYKDINVVLPNMGRHFLLDTLVDGRFDPEHPELLVYSPVKGQEVLVAVEYAVPLAVSANPPEGFKGAGDVWFPDQTFKLWTLHAWVWRNNPDGMFTATNKQVP